MIFTTDCGALWYEPQNIAALFWPDVRGSKGPPPEEGDFVALTAAPNLTRVDVEVSLGGARHRFAVEGAKGEIERLVSLALYRFFERQTGFTPKWGILTGIRPVKAVAQRLLSGESGASIARHLTENHLVHPQKAELLLAVAGAELPLIREPHPRDCSLYISIPFCPSRCSYCSFVSQTTARDRGQLLERYFPLLLRELEATAALIRRHELSVRSVYIGGGTPTTLSAPQVRELLCAVARQIPLPPGTELCCEAGRPDTLDEDKLRAMREGGVTRICVNPQTMQDDILRAIGRAHAASDVRDIVKLVQSLDFQVLNMDLIAGLPGDAPDRFAESLGDVIAMGPENITVHSLSHKRASRLVVEGAERDLEGAAVDAMLESAYRLLGAAGYIPYYLYRQKNTAGGLENVGFAKPGHLCRYNVFMMDETHSVLAVGAGGVTRMTDRAGGRIERVWGYKYPREYVDHFDEVLRRRGEVEAFLQNSFAPRG